MPAVVWCAIGFTAGDLAGLLLARGSGWVLAPLLAAGALALWRSGPGAARAAVLLTAAAAGTLWGGAAAARASSDCRARWREGERVAVVVGLWDVAVPGSASRARVRWPARCAGPIVVAWPRGGAAPATAAVVVGTWHRSAARVGARLPARPDREGRVVARHVRPLAQPPGPRAALRLAAERRIPVLFGAARAPLVYALTVGDGDQLDRAVRQRFVRAGIAHILSISGLHVGILGVALVLVLRAARVRDGPARLAGGAVVALYVALLGFPAPALRSLGLIALWTLSRLRQRPIVPYAALAVTAVLVLAFDPFAVVEAGPWLSFAGAWGCVAAARHWAVLRRARAVPRGRSGAVLDVVAVSGGATLATAPFSAVAFGTMAPAALVSNVLAVPLAGVVVPALALTMVLAALAPPAAAVVAGAAGLGLDALDAVARLAGAIPLASLAFERRLLAALVLAVVAWLVLRPCGAAARAPATPGAAGARGAPETPRRRLRRAALARLALAGGVAAAAAAWWPLVPAPPSGYRPRWLALHFLAVGQGDAAALRTPAGRWILVDGGPRVAGFDAGASVVTPFLRRAGARRLALAVASHGDEDHLGGLRAVVRAFRPELVLEPGEPLPRSGYRRFLAAAARAGSRWHPARAGDSVALDGVVLRVIHPGGEWLSPVNENSVAVVVAYGAFRALLPGDGGRGMEAAPGFLARVPRVTLLKVAHHGSRFATGAALRAAAAPALCVISVGPNGFGQPDPGVVRSLAGAGCRVLRTDVEGTVTVETDGRVVEVRAGGRDTTFTLTREQP